MSKGQNTREMIIRKASELFNMKGYAGCSMSDLMDATGLKKGGIYNHFSDKDEISLEAFKYSIAQLENRLAEVTRSADTEKGRLVAIFEFYREYATHPVIQGGCPIVNTIVDADDTNPALITLAHQSTERMLRRLEFIILQGQRHNEFRKQTSSREIALMIFSGIEGAILLSRAYDNDEAMQAMITCLEDYLHNNVYL